MLPADSVVAGASVASVCVAAGLQPEAAAVELAVAAAAVVVELAVELQLPPFETAAAAVAALRFVERLGIAAVAAADGVVVRLPVAAETVAAAAGPFAGAVFELGFSKKNVRH